jgi:hypothetical protein
LAISFYLPLTGALMNTCEDSLIANQSVPLDSWRFLDYRYHRFSAGSAGFGNDHFELFSCLLDDGYHSVYVPSSEVDAIGGHEKYVLFFCKNNLMVKTTQSDLFEGWF